MNILMVLGNDAVCHHWVSLSEKCVHDGDAPDTMLECERIDYTKLNYYNSLRLPLFKTKNNLKRIVSITWIVNTVIVATWILGRVALRLPILLCPTWQSHPCSWATSPRWIRLEANQLLCRENTNLKSQLARKCYIMLSIVCALYHLVGPCWTVRIV